MACAVLFPEDPYIGTSCEIAVNDYSFRSSCSELFRDVCEPDGKGSCFCVCVATTYLQYFG